MRMIEVYTDGASCGNPGPSGAGVYIKHGQKHYKYSYFLGDFSNHEAEFHAVIKALMICKDTFPSDILSFRSDSRIVVDTIEKNHTKNTLFIPLLHQICELASDFPHFFIKWIPEKQNKQADKLARIAIQHQTNRQNS